MNYWKAQAAAANAHCTLIRRQLDEAKEQVANLEKKKTRGKKNKTLARIVAFEKYRDAFDAEDAEREAARQAELEKQTQKAADQAARETRMATETRTRIFRGPLSTYKRDDLLVLARALHISDSGNVSELRNRIREHLRDNSDRLSQDVRFGALVGGKASTSSLGVTGSPMVNRPPQVPLSHGQGQFQMPYVPFSFQNPHSLPTSPPGPSVPWPSSSQSTRHPLGVYPYHIPYAYSIPTQNQ
jgi:hypothetical protein